MAYWVAFGGAFGISAVLTAVVLVTARRFGWMARPRADRWHHRPTALFGGVAVYLAVMAMALLALPLDRQHVGVLAGTTAVFGLGLADDILSIKPYTKLIGQIAAACILIFSGVHVAFVIHPLLAIPLTVLWVVGITNAFNLLDNMDGLSSGVAVIAAAFLFLFTRAVDPTAVAVLAMIIAGAAGGFLLFNFNPARIFMGDCGSMTLGFLLASAGVMGTWHHAGNLFLILAVPVLILAVPIFDTTLVTVLRKLSGRAVSQGGRDHSSHRLVALGLSERRAVLLLWALAAAFGGIALLGDRVNLFAAAVTAALLVIGIFFFGVFLGEVPIYRDVPEGEDDERPALINTLLLHKRRIVEVTVDFVLICVAYVAAYLLRFEGELSDANLRLIYQSLPIIIVVKMTAFFFFGLYRGVWRYVGMTDALNIGKAVVSGSLVSGLVLLLAYRFEGYSRSVLILDGLLLLFLVAGVRTLLRVFREAFFTPAADGRRVIVVGAGDAGEMLIREMRGTPGIGVVPVGLVDDDREKHGRSVHGVPVLGALADLKALVTRHGADEVLIAIPRATGAEMKAIVDACTDAGVAFRTSPRLSELIDGTVRLRDVRELDVADLLGRAPISSDGARLRAAVEGRAVLITGAAGTVGAGVARRARAYGARRLVLVDRDDNRLGRLAEELGGADGVQVIVADVTDFDATTALLRRVRPDLVVHTAGVNQVALLEGSAAGAVRANVMGTASVLAAAREVADTLVLVSTGKAFGARSVAVATRVLAEDLVRARAPETMAVRVVRLPNVLESPGGVLQRFREQADAERPLTVTVPEAARRFVTAAEAAGLVLEAAAADVDRNRALVPRSVSPLPVADLARAVLQVSGHPVGRDGGIEFVGLRPGESLDEPWPGTDALEDIELESLAAVSLDPVDADAVEAAVERLRGAVAAADDPGAVRILAEWLEPSEHVAEIVEMDEKR